MNHYQKPIISIDTGMAEGIYAASGATESAVTFSELSKLADWGNNNGQLSFTADLSKLANKAQLTLTITFSSDITNIWGGGANASYNGKTATLSWYSAPDVATLTVQVDTNLSNIHITGYTYSNAQA